MEFARGQRIRLPGDDSYSEVLTAVPLGGGAWQLFLHRDKGLARVEEVTAEQVPDVSVLVQDGRASPKLVLAGLWTEWMLSSVRSSRSTVLASTSLDRYPHQMDAVYGRMLPQPELRFLLADEPGTGKTIMSGLWLREAQRLGLAERALVVCPAHLVTKWQADFEDFFGGGLRRITPDTIREKALNYSSDDTWIVSLELAANTRSVREALHPDRALWDTVIIDEAHRLTPTAEASNRVGLQLSKGVQNLLLLTATPHRGKDAYFRFLMHLVDPSVFPEDIDDTDVRRSRSMTPGRRRSPGRLHFLRRMKEDLRGYDTDELLFKEREARNLPVQMNSEEQRYYDSALELVNAFFPRRARGLAGMVYGKRAASSLYALSKTLQRRLDKMGTEPTLSYDDIPIDEPDEVLEGRSVDAAAEREGIEMLLADLEPVVSPQASGSPGQPSKWAPMIRELARHKIVAGNEAQAVVFTEFTDTAVWLVDRFQQAGFTTERYSGDVDHKERVAIQKRFMDGKFQVIVSTDAGNEGIDLQAAHVLVNWDIPWSLVKLEQRMGRIHRIGQTQKVWLYNIVALGTREGDAHQRLLERLTEAANELDGKMFNSLAAVMERAFSGNLQKPEELLSGFYHPDRAPHEAGIDPFPTVEEIRNARDDYYSESGHLGSTVGTDAANAARRDDRLDQINPVIVERFLARIDDSGLIKGERTYDEGHFYLTAIGGWELPASLPDVGEGRSRVVTQPDTRYRQAHGTAQERDEQAVMLGPSTKAFADLVEALRNKTGPDMMQGATLHDETAHDDYMLFVYECELTEGTDGPSRRLNARENTRSWLFRVEKQNRTRTVAWETITNLTASEQASPEVIADDIVEAAHRAAEAEAEAEREQATARLGKWADEMIEELRRLPDDVTEHITDQRRRISERRRIKQVVEARKSDISAAARVTRGEVRLVGWAHVNAAAVRNSADTRRNSDRTAMRFVTRRLANSRWDVVDVSQQGLGYDLRAVRGAEMRCIEVKGCDGSASSRGVPLTSNEVIKGKQLGADYWLYVVDHCRDGRGKLYGAWQNPMDVFGDAFRDLTVHRLRGSTLRNALDRQGNDS